MWSCFVFVLAAAQASPALHDLLDQARQMLESSDRSGARRELMRASSLYPGHPVVDNFLGALEAEEGNYRGAEARFRTAVEHAPRYTEAYLNLGRLYQQNAARDSEAVRKALEAYQAILGYEPDHAEAHYQSAVLLQARGDFRRSLDHLSRLPAEAQQRAQALAIRCADLAALGEHGKADAAAEQVLSHPELEEPDVLSILPTLSTQQRSELALRLLDGLRRRGLASAEGLHRLAMLYESQGALDRAREALEAAAAGSSESVELLLDLARLAHKQRDHRGALGYLAHARDLAPQDARIHFFFGMVCVDLELGVEAYNSLKEAVRLAPDNPYMNYALGAVAMHRHDAAEAVPYFERYARLKPDDPRAAFAVGSALYKAGNFAAAREQLSKAALQPQTAAGAHYLIGRMAREENDLATALGEVQKALAADPQYTDAWAELGFLQLRNSEHQQAEKALRRCLEIEPDNYLGNFHLLMLYQRTKDARQTDQQQRFEELKKRREQKAGEFFRLIEVRPY